MKTPPLYPQIGKFIGRDGLMGLQNGMTYSVEVFMRTGNVTRQPIICVSRVGDRQYFLPYKTMKKFQMDWDFVNT